MDNNDPRLRALKLPKRYEALEQQAQESHADITRIVQRVDLDATRVETLLRQARDGGLGRFEIFLGPSGSGKTTFFKTLTKFFAGTDVYEIPPDLPLSDVANHIRAKNYKEPQRQVWVLTGRDNPQVTKAEAFAFFELLRVFFREPQGRVVLAWPITDQQQAALLSAEAWNVGRDSVVDLKTRGVHKFHGPDRLKFAFIADLTVKTLTGQRLEVFGLTPEVVDPLVAQSETISEFYSRLEAQSAEINALYRDLLRQRIVPYVWVLVAGDVAKELGFTVANLTSGTKNYIDIDQIISYLDEPGLDAAYLKEWKNKRSEIALLLKLLDVRVFELPPNVSLPAIRAFGSDDVRAVLKLQKTSAATAIDALQKSAFIQAILDPTYSRKPYSKDTDAQASYEYRRIQAKAAKIDKKLNKALGTAIEETLKATGVMATVITEKQDDDGNLKPDIKITLGSGQVYCIEPTWRSTGEGVPTELDARQNTLTVGHIRKYLLEKLLGYVNDLNL
jgi:hypothetical protein